MARLNHAGKIFVFVTCPSVLHSDLSRTVLRSFILVVYVPSERGVGVKSVCDHHGPHYAIRPARATDGRRNAAGMGSERRQPRVRSAVGNPQ